MSLREIICKLKKQCSGRHISHESLQQVIKTPQNITGTHLQSISDNDEISLSVCTKPKGY